MYERNAILLDRYFNQLFGYNMKNNIKTNFTDYCSLVECLEKYKNISEEEENIIQEYDEIANKIREIQKIQENLNRKNIKLIEETNNIFQNIDENTDSIQKKITSLNNSIDSITSSTQENEQSFIQAVSDFNEKSKIRMTCSKSRRNIENEYNKKINTMLDNYQEIDLSCEKKARQFIDMNTENLEKNLKIEMLKNGENEKIPFNTNVIVKAITLCVDIQKRETDIYAGIYEKTNKLFTEIKNNTIKIDKHKKVIKDSKCKLNFLASLKEYLIQFLDNERLTSVNGEEEHTKLMNEACKSIDEDLSQINNLYTLLLKEISKKITKKSYLDLYNYDYLEKLELTTNEFDSEIKKLNLSVTIINPNHWRIEGMKKIYETFNKCVVEEYNRDLTDFLPKPGESYDNIPSENDEDLEFDEISEPELEKSKVKDKDKENDKENDQNKKSKTEDISSKDSRSEIDRKIDKILGLHSEDDDNDSFDSFEDDDDLVWHNNETQSSFDINSDWDDDYDEFEDNDNLDSTSDDFSDDDIDDDINDEVDDDDDIDNENDDEDEVDTLANEKNSHSKNSTNKSKSLKNEDWNWDEDENKDEEDNWDDELNIDEDDEYDIEDLGYNKDSDDDIIKKNKSNKIKPSKNSTNSKKSKNKPINKSKDIDWDDDSIWNEDDTKLKDEPPIEKTSRRRERTEEDWENAFIKIKQKNKEKKKSFFDKFRK